jgi:hypothetical protein
MTPAPLATLLLSLAASLLTACGSASPGPAAAGENTALAPSASYPIVLERGFDLGTTYRERRENETTTTTMTRREGQVVEEKSETKRVTLTGTLRSLAAGKGQPVEYRELSLVREGRAQTLLPQGATIVKTPAGSQWQYTVNGLSVSETVHDALSKLLGRTVGGKTSDDLLGSKKPRAVGERWSAVIAPFPAEEEFAIDPEPASGFTQIVGLRHVRGIECLEIAAELSYPKVTLKHPPEDATITGASLKTQFSGLLPVDTHLPALRTLTTTHLTLDMDVTLPDGPATWEVAVHNEATLLRDWGDHPYQHEH